MLASGALERRSIQHGSRPNRPAMLLRRTLFGSTFRGARLQYSRRTSQFNVNVDTSRTYERRSRRTLFVGVRTAGRSAGRPAGPPSRPARGPAGPAGPAGPVARCSAAPRSDCAYFEITRSLKPIDALPAWAMSCLFVAADQRRPGLARQMGVAAAEHALRQGAPVLQA